MLVMMLGIAKQTIRLFIAFDSIGLFLKYVFVIF